MPVSGAKVLKFVGLAGAVGVAATGVMVVRDERKRRAYTPEEVREQLHVRYTAAYNNPNPIERPAKPTMRDRLEKARGRLRR